MHARTVAHKQSVLAWLRDLATRAGAEDPDSLARSLALLLDGGLADGALAADPGAARAAKQSGATPGLLGSASTVRLTEFEICQHVPHYGHMTTDTARTAPRRLGDTGPPWPPSGSA